MELKVKENQLIEILSLALMHPGSSVTSAPENEITNQVYPGVWAMGIPGRAKHVASITVELKEEAKPI